MITRWQEIFLDSLSFLVLSSYCFHTCCLHSQLLFKISFSSFLSARITIFPGTFRTKIMGDISVRKSLRLTRQELRRGWSFRQTDSSVDVWYPVQNIPSVVHLDLMQNNLYAQHMADTFITTKTRTEFRILSLE
jgi:hypothetical protein